MKKILFLFTLLACVSNINAQWWSSEAAVVAAGNGQGGEANQINQPSMIYVTSDNTIYIADLPNHRIQKWEEGATEGVTVAGDGINSQEPESIGFPTGIFVDEQESGNVMYIVDAIGHKVIRWVEGETEGVVVAGGAGFGTELFQLNFPAGVLKKGNDLYIADSGNQRILRWTLDEDEGVVVAGGNGFGDAPNQLGMATLNGAIYVDNDNNIYVAEYINGRVSKWAPGATEGEVVAQGTDEITLINANGVVVTDDGLVIVSDFDWESNSISVWQNGELIGYIQETGSTDVLQPVGLALNGNNDLYVAEYGNHAIRRFDYLIPQISILGNGLEIDNGSASGSVENDTDFGEVAFGESLTKTFSVTNVGGFNLEVTDISLAESGDFTLTSSVSFIIAPGETESFDITYEPSDYDLDQSDLITVLSNDSVNSGVFTFTVQATSDVNTTGVNEIDVSSSIRIFPNPSSNGKFEILSEENMRAITLYDILGKEAKRVQDVSTSETIDVSALPSGLYIITIELSDGKLYSSKLVKN